MSEYMKYNKEEHLTCKTCGETKEEKHFRKRRGGFVNTSCRSCVNVKFVPNPTTAHLNAVRCRAKKANIPFNLTEEDLAIPEVCPVLGIKLGGWGDGDISKGRYNETAPSIDRLIPSVGYVKENIRIISNRANFVKKDASLEEIERLYFWLKKEMETLDTRE